MGFRITLILIFAIMFASSQTDSTDSKWKIGIGIYPTFFIDYSSKFEKEDLYPNWLNNGLDLNLCITKNRHVLEMGVLAGDAYPVLHFLNYYIGYDFRLTPKKWKFEVLANSRFMYMRHREKYAGNLMLEWKELSMLTGPTLQITRQRFQWGVSYYFMFHNFSLTETNRNTSKILFKDSQAGYLQTGMIELKANVLLKN